MTKAHLLPVFSRQWWVQAVYATHNDSRAVRNALARCLKRLENGGRCLNVGAGRTRVHPDIVNVDLVAGPAADCVARAEWLPFASETFSVVITQETLEHVKDPNRAVAEIYRVLRPGGVLYCQLPFVIGYHPGPTDFWRFTREGIRELVEGGGFRCDELAVSVGTGTGMYRIAVEFWAVLACRLATRLYYPVKAISSLLFFPLKWTDALLDGNDQSDRIPGGYYVIASRPG